MRNLLILLTACVIGVAGCSKEPAKPDPGTVPEFKSDRKDNMKTITSPEGG